jgi:3D (Asp-Asp-Asp) domain-containing protein
MKTSMKRIVTASGLILLFASAASAHEKASVAREQIFLARVTVYWASGGGGSDRYTRQHKCATGMRLRDGHCAVDPRKIPYGSQLVFPDRSILLAVDTGTAVRNRKAARQAGRTVCERNAIVVDRFFETKRQALGWAQRNPPFMAVRVVPPNYRAQSTTRVIQPAVPQTKLLDSNALVANASRQSPNRPAVRPISATRMQ